MIIYNLNLFGQITFPQILSLEDKPYKEIQGFLFNSHSLISQTTVFAYFPIEECNPPQYQEDGCEWFCQSVIGVPVQLDYRTTQPNFKDTSVKNYIERTYYETSYGENYNSKKNTATTFIDIKQKEEWANTNCKNEFKYMSKSSITFKIQFGDFNHWDNFKKSVIKNSQFQGVDDLKMEGYTPTVVYGIRRKKAFNGQWKGVYIRLYEGKKQYFADIGFNSYGVE